MRLPLLTLLLLLALTTRSQLADSFSDSNFSAAPPWTGTPGAWTVNAQRQLQSTHPVANSAFWLSTPNALAMGAEWSLWLRLAFAPSSANYVDVWLLAQTPAPDAAGNTGYFVRIGGTQDDICLYRKDPSGTVKLIDGPDGVTAGSDNRLRLQVLRSAGGKFLLRHAPESGPFISDGQATDATYTSGAYFALLVRQSTASFFGKHYFDDILIAPFASDTLAPSILATRAPDDSTVEIRFSEPPDPAGINGNNFTLAGLGAPRSAVIDPVDATLVQLRFSISLPADTPLLLTVRHISDSWGNELVQDTDRFFYHPPRYHDVLLSEIMADPDPPRALPPQEYVELHNRSVFPICLRGWRLATPTTRSAPLPNYWLQPDSFVLLTGTAAAPAFAPFGPALGIGSFPALDNDGTLLQLLDAAGRSIHALAYQRGWYRSAVKDDGGWSLELIDPGNPCGGAENWRASEDARGGTPAARNSVAASVPDHIGPILLRAWAPDNRHIVTEFSEPLDSLQAARSLFQLDGGLQVVAARPLPPLFRTIALQVNDTLRQGRVYRLGAAGTVDCSGNALRSDYTVPVGLAADPVPGNLVINELLYQPRTGGAEYVELFVQGATVDASHLFLATRTSTGAFNTPKRLSETALFFYPDEYHVLTGDDTDVSNRYFVAHPAWLHLVASLPALSDDGATVALLNDRGQVLDEVPYSPRWQFPLLADAHGVALERLDPQAPSAARDNWHSAAETAGFGTPTARNSQYRGAAGAGMLSVEPAVISPDNDGFNDVALIGYELEESGYVANLTVYDALGHPQRHLVQNALLGRSGRWNFDGLDDVGRPLAVGTYLLLAELFHPDGNRKLYKRTVTIARKFR